MVTGETSRTLKVCEAKLVEDESGRGEKEEIMEITHVVPVFQHYNEYKIPAEVK